MDTVYFHVPNSHIFSYSCRVAFSNQQSYIAAISARFVQLQHGEIDKRVRRTTLSATYVTMRYTCKLLLTGRSETVRAGRPAVRRVPGRAVRRQVRALLLRQRDLPAVLLRTVLGHHTLAPGQGVPQAAGQGGRRQAQDRAIQVVLRKNGRKGAKELSFPHKTPLLYRTATLLLFVIFPFPLLLQPFPCKNRATFCVAQPALVRQRNTTGNDIRKNTNLS